MQNRGYFHWTTKQTCAKTTCSYMTDGSEMYYGRIEKRNSFHYIYVVKHEVYTDKAHFLCQAIFYGALSCLGVIL